MDRRTLFALLLTAIVIVVTPMLFPAPKQPRRPTADTAGAQRNSDSSAPIGAVPIPEKQAAPSVPTAKPSPSNAQTAAAETTVVRTNRIVYYLTSPGGTPSSVTLPEYHSLRPDAPRVTPVSLVDGRDRLLRLRVVTDRDTIALDTVAFKAAPPRREGNVIVQSLSSRSSAIPITLTYRFPADSFVL